MEHYVSKDSTIRVPVKVWSAASFPRRTTWTAQVHFDRHSSRTSQWDATAKTEKEAKEALAAQLMGALDNQRDGMILVIGGGECYQNSIHLVTASRWGTGWDVYVVRTADGTASLAGSWLGNQDTQAETLHGVLRHVGGTPAVVRI